MVATVVVSIVVVLIVILALRSVIASRKRGDCCSKGNCNCCSLCSGQSDSSAKKQKKN